MSQPPHQGDELNEGVSEQLGVVFAPPSGQNLQGHFLVNFSRGFPHHFGAIVNFHQTAVNFSQFESVLVNLSQF